MLAQNLKDLPEVWGIKLQTVSNQSQMCEWGGGIPTSDFTPPPLWKNYALPPPQKNPSTIPPKNPEL